MSLFKSKVELIVIRDPSNPQQSIEYYSGRNLEGLVKQAFKSGISDSVRFYHADLTREVFGIDERKDKQAIKAFCGLKGRVYAQVVPMGLDPVSWIIIGVSVAVSLAATFLLAPKMPDAGSQSQPPSPNNALAARSNKQRLGGRVPDIFGEVWSVPDLIAPTYSIYDNNKEVEFSYMCVGRGKHEVKQALDDTTPINQVFGSSVLVYDPGKTLNDEPAFVFGEQFRPNEAEFARFAAKRYTSVNGQVLTAPDAYLKGSSLTFRNPNIIETDDNISFLDKYKVGEKLLIEGATDLKSGNNITTGADPDITPVTYSLNGQYIIEAVTEKQITLSNPSSVNTDWQKLTNNVDFTVKSDAATLSTEPTPLWQGYFYTDLKDHDGAYVNITAPALYRMGKKGDWVGLRLYGEIESEIVDNSNNPVAGTLHTQTFTIQSPESDRYGWGDEGSYDENTRFTKDDRLRASAAVTVKLDNPNFAKGKRLRFRIARKSNAVGDNSSEELKLKDFYGYHVMTEADMPKGVTTVYAKTLATEGALSIKERKLRLLVERYVTDYYTKDLRPSKRADDIIYHAAIDPKIGGLTDEQIDFEQIKNEIDILIDYFGSEKFAEFCYTFDDNNLSSEEIIQTFARAVFSNAKRYGNKLMLDFEREVPASVAVFNSHNILPDSYAASESFGVINEYDGAKVEYADPVDDAQVTKSYPSEAAANPHTEKLIGVRNELQATAHMMRLYNKDRYTYKSCEITAGDESNIVTRTNRITVASQTAVDVQQGTVEGVEVIDSDIVLHTSHPVNVSGGSYLFIQTINNGVESIACSPRDEQSVTLARLPQGELSIRNPRGLNAIYQIVGSNDGDKDAYIVTKKDPAEDMTNKLTCTNYSSKFYQNDKDYLNSI